MVNEQNQERCLVPTVNNKRVFLSAARMISLLLSVTIVFLTSCDRSTPQDVSRSTRSEVIIVSSDDVSTETESQVSTENKSATEPAETYDPESWLVRVSDPKLYENGPYEPEEYDFSITLKDDLLIVDYGISEVNLYKARYAEVPANTLEEQWQINGASSVIEWCEGWPVSLSWDSNHMDGGKDRVSLSQSAVLKNFHNVGLVSLSEIEDVAYIADCLEIDINEKVLAWTYDTSGFPWDSEYLSDNKNFRVSPDIECVQYIPLCCQFLDGLPVRRDYNDGPVFDWSDDIPLSRSPNWDPLKNWSGVFMNSSQSSVMLVFAEKYEIENTLSERQSVISPETCQNEIKKAILYNNFSHIKSTPDPNRWGLHDIWETDVVVYCMELAYMVLDPTPLEWFDDHLETHELTIVPVWVVYYTATNSKTADENIVYNGTVMLNAVTGRSIYSETYGPEENDYLYPHAKDPG